MPSFADFLERHDLHSKWLALKRWAPLLAFFGGFLFDVLTLGRKVYAINLMLVSFYAIATFLTLLVRARVETKESSDRLLELGQNFFLGAVFSALVVLYFKSAGHLMALLVVAALFGAMTWNEFFRSKASGEEGQVELVWGIYAVSLAMLFNFLIPYLVDSVSPWWFYVSTAAAALVLLGLRWLAARPWRKLRAPLALIAALPLLYALGWIPPVPLVLENTLSCTDFAKEKGEYTCRVDEPGWRVRWGMAWPEVTYAPGEPVWALTAVFAPRDVEVTMVHRWYHQEEGDWRLYDTMSFDMVGGRERGWRFYSRKRNMLPGTWKVETALEDGPVLGRQIFVARPAEGEKGAKKRAAL